MLETLTEWARSMLTLAQAHPGLVGVLVTAVVWPMLSGAASFADQALGRRFPIAMAILRTVGFDAKRFAAIVLSDAMKARKLPVPPEVTELTIQRIDKAVSESKRPPMGEA